MHPHAQTCLLLLVGVLTSCGSGGTIGNKDSQIYFETSEEEQITNYPLWKTGPDGSHRQNVKIGSSKFRGTQISRVTLEQVSGSSPQSQVYTSSELPMEVKPLLDEDELIAFELDKLKTTLPPSASTPPTTAITVAASQQPSSGGSGIASELAEIFKSILDESAVRGESTTQRPRQPPRVDVTSQKPLASSTENAAEFPEFITQIEEVIKSVLVKDKPEQSQPTSAAYLPPPQRPKLPPNTEEDLKHILPALEEALGSILNSEAAKVPTTTRQPVLPTGHPTTTTTGSKQHFAAVLPQLEDAIRSVLEEAVKEEEAKAQQHTTQRPLPTQQQPSPQTTKDYGFGNFMPELEQVVGDILLNQQSNHSATFPNTADTMSTVRTPILPVTATTSEQAFFQNIIVPDSEPLFQAVKSTLADVLIYQELKARKSQIGS